MAISAIRTIGLDPSRVAKAGDMMTGNLLFAKGADVNFGLSDNFGLHFGVNNIFTAFQISGGNGLTTKAKFHLGGVFFPVQAPTATAPAYVEGGMYYDTTLHKLRIGGAAGWETVTSV